MQNSASASSTLVQLMVAVEVTTLMLKDRDDTAPSPPHPSRAFGNSCFRVGMSSITGSIQETWVLSHIAPHRVQEVKASR